MIDLFERPIQWGEQLERELGDSYQRGMWDQRCLEPQSARRVQSNQKRGSEVHLRSHGE